MLYSMLRIAFGFACLCTLGALSLVFMEPRGGAPFWIAVWTLLIALLFLLTVIVMIRLIPRMPPGRRGGDA